MQKRGVKMDLFSFKGIHYHYQCLLKLRKNQRGIGVIGLFILLCGCALTTGRMPSSSRVPTDTTEMRSLPFEARSLGAQHFRPRVLILMAKMNESLISKEWSQKAETELMRQLRQTESYVLLKPKEVDLNTKDLVNQDQWDWTKIHERARAKSIPLVLEWELLPIEIQQKSDAIGILREQERKIVVQLKVRLLETRQGKEIFSEIGQAVKEDRDVLWLSKNDKKITVNDYSNETLRILLKEAISTVMPEVAAQAIKMAWNGRVAMIKGDRIYLNVGRQSGLQIGDILKVLDVGDEVFDPDTGESIGKVPGRMKGTLEVVHYFGTDGAVAVVHSGAGFQENDAIELY